MNLCVSGALYMCPCEHARSDWVGQKPYRCISAHCSVSQANVDAPGIILGAPEVTAGVSGNSGVIVYCKSVRVLNKHFRVT